MAALVLGVISLVPFAGLVTGVPAIILGARARRDIDLSHGALDGRGLAASGIVSGLFGTGFAAVLMLWILGVAFAPTPPEPSAAGGPTGASAVPADTSTTPSSTSSGDTTDPPPAAAPAAAGVRSYGSLEVIDLDQSRSLRSQLGEIVRRSHGRTIVLQTYVKASDACVAIDAALPDTRMQRALANVTLVRVDVEEYDRELGAMKVETRSAPWFYKLDAKGDPTDGISADAWEANIPENMAPVLGKFVHRSPVRRAPRGESHRL